MSKNMRTTMPKTAALIDELREVFGKELVDQMIRDGMKGKQGFWASENGHEIGTKIEHGRTAVRWDAQGTSYLVDLTKDNSEHDN